MKGLARSLVCPSTNTLTRAKKAWLRRRRSVGEAVRTKAIPELDDLQDELAICGPPSDEIRERLLRSVGELTSAQRTALLDLHEEINSRFHGTSYFNRMLRLLRASLLNNADEVAAELTFLTYIERDLRAITPRLLQDSFGDNWFRETKDFLPAEDESVDELDQTDATQKAKFKGFSLQQLFSVAREAASKGNRFGEAFDAALGPDWPDHTRLIVDLRNDFAHGRLVDRDHFTDFDKGWGSDIERIMIALRFADGFAQLKAQNATES